MELNNIEAAAILNAHKIDAFGDPRSIVEIATTFILTGSTAIDAVPEIPMDSVTRIQAEIAWPE